MDSFKNKQVTVLGLARSGEAAAKLLSHLEASVLVSDQKDEEQLRDRVARLVRADAGIRFCLGGHPDEIVEEADLVVVSPGVPSNIPILKKAREKGIPVIGEVELAYRVCPAPIIAITGTKGKSTTATLIGKILTGCAAGRNVVQDGRIVGRGGSFIHRRWAGPRLGGETRHRGSQPDNNREPGGTPEAKRFAAQDYPSEHTHAAYLHLPVPSGGACGGVPRTE